MNNYDANNAEHRMALALDFVDRMNGSESAFDRAAHQYQICREALVAKYDQEYLSWAASRGLDY